MLRKTKRTAAGIPTWSPTVVLICRSTAYVWQSGRDAQFSADCGRTYLFAISTDYSLCQKLQRADDAPSIIDAWGYTILLILSREETRAVELLNPVGLDYASKIT